MLFKLLLYLKISRISVEICNNLILLDLANSKLYMEFSLDLLLHALIFFSALQGEMMISRSNPFRVEMEDFTRATALQYLNYNRQSTCDLLVFKPSKLIHGTSVQL